MTYSFRFVVCWHEWIFPAALLWILLCGLHCKVFVLWLVVCLGMFHVKRGGLFGVVVVVLWVGIVLP